MTKGAAAVELRQNLSFSATSCWLCPRDSDNERGAFWAETAQNNR
jgi:hypothetical protein